MQPKRKVTLVTGAARSGKSEWAELLAIKTDKPVIYVATAMLNSADPEWQDRIEQHRQRRPSSWQVLEVPRELVTIIETSTVSSCLLVDSLGTWVANYLTTDNADWEKIVTQLLTSLPTQGPEVIFVAEETGWGIVPAYPLGRLFRDRLGNLIRQIGAIATDVYLVTGGHALNLTLLGQSLP